MNCELNWSPRPSPALAAQAGRWVAVEPAAFPAAADALFPVLGGPENAGLWTYIAAGPFDSAAAFSESMARSVASGGWMTHLFRDAGTGAALGMASYMRIRPEAGSAEVGCVVFSRAMQRRPPATEAMYLMARHIFDDLGYRRYEWKCDDANEASKRAARRFGFTFEGVFRQDLVVKGRNRDTAWFSMIDAEWPAAKAAFETWLAPENFQFDGTQRRRLEDIRAAAR